MDILYSLRRVLRSLIDSRYRISYPLLYCCSSLQSGHQVKLHQLVPDLSYFRWMGRSDRLANMNKVHVCTETTRKEQSAIRLRHMSGGPNGCHRQLRPRFAEAEGKSNAEWWQYKEDRLRVMKDQIEDLTTQVSDWCHHNGNGSKNPFTERQTQGRQHLAQAHANWWVSRFKLDIPEFQGCLWPKEYMVIEKNRKFPQKKVSKKIAIVT